MHPSQLPEEILERVAARRGRPYAFPVLEARRTAVVVIDMQNAFVAPGAPGEIAAARGIVPNINRLAGAARAAGARVAWVQSDFPLDRPAGGWPVFFGEIFNPALAANYVQALRYGSDGHALWPELRTEPGDLFARKDRFSAFLPGASDLPERLAAEGIDTVLIAGTLTNVCCESSGRDAMMRNYRVILVGDANATRSDAEHLAALITFHQTFGDVRSTGDAIAMLEASPR